MFNTVKKAVLASSTSLLFLYSTAIHAAPDSFGVDSNSGRGIKNMVETFVGFWQGFFSIFMILAVIVGLLLAFASLVKVARISRNKEQGSIGMAFFGFLVGCLMMIFSTIVVFTTENIRCLFSDCQAEGKPSPVLTTPQKSGIQTPTSINGDVR